MVCEQWALSDFLCQHRTSHTIVFISILYFSVSVFVGCCCSISIYKGMPHACCGNVFNSSKRHRWQWWSRRVSGTKCRQADDNCVWDWQLDQTITTKHCFLPHAICHFLTSLHFSTYIYEMRMGCASEVAVKQLRISPFIHKNNNNNNNNQPLNTYISIGNEQWDKHTAHTTHKAQRTEHRAKTHRWNSF